MGNLLGGSSSNGGLGQATNYGYGPELQCCDAVVDPVSLFSTIGAITAISLFLRQAVIDNNVMGNGKRKKRSVIEAFDFVFKQGTLSFKVVKEIFLRIP